MVKRALCIGINDYPVRGMDLKGCVNDARAWAKLLVDQYDFAKPDVSMLLDKRATKANVVKGIKSLLTGARRGDVLVLTNSSHGTYVADRDGDETRYDEAMCPWDTKDELIVDDELRELFAGIPTGVRMTFISDSCHSGSLTRAMPPELTPDDRRPRFLDPESIGLRTIDNPGLARSKRSAKHAESSMKEVFLSGCREDQFSFDARFGRKHHGAMTFTALAVIAAAGYRVTYSEVQRKIVQELDDAMFDQEPQLEGRAAAKRRQLFT